MKRKGFSLIELLVVMAILGMLTSIVIPTSTRFVGLARRTKCVTNLGQLMQMISLTQQAKRLTGERALNEPRYFEKESWPQLVAGEVQSGRIFACPDGINPLEYGHPPFIYQSGIDKSCFVTFDPQNFLCAMRKGVDENGKEYTEYVIEENPGVQSKWSHEECCGQPSWSTNDGIWRVYDYPEEGRRKMILTYYDCGWPNVLYFRGEGHWSNLSTHVGEEFEFFDVLTNYGYNAMLGRQDSASPDTVVLMDSNRIHVDPDALTMTTDLHDLDTARHFGKINVLYASGSVATVGPASLYPDVNPAPWTPEDD